MVKETKNDEEDHCQKKAKVQNGFSWRHGQDRKFPDKSYTPFNTPQGNKIKTISEMEIFQESYTDICQVGRSSLPSQISSPAMM